MVSTTDEVITETTAVDLQQVPTEIKAISEEDFEKAQKTFQLGKKNLFLCKYDESVNNIEEACKIYSSKYGEFDPQCAEVYFFYGRALLELARVENTVLGNALNGVPEDTSPIDDSRYGNPEDVAAEEKNEISEKVIDALCEASDAVEKKAAELNGDKVENNEEIKEQKIDDNKQEEKPLETKDETKEEKAEEKDEIKSEESADKKDEIKEDEQIEDEDGDEEAEGDEDITKNDEQNKEADAETDDISNLQRSWEMFELAKLIYSKNFDDDLPFKTKRIAECLLKLGEISIEQELYEQAINDIGESIKLQEEQKEKRDERMLAESFYQLGLAQQFNNLFTEANESYQKSINIVQLRIEKLKGKLEQFEKESTEDKDIEIEKNSAKEEIGELEALLPEMTAKLEEVNEQGQQSLNLIKEAKECFLNTISNDSKLNGTPTNGEVKDITSMVKSKRKMPNDEEAGTVKKTRLSGTDDLVQTNGNHTETNNIEMTDDAKIEQNNQQTEIPVEEQKMEETKENESKQIDSTVEEKSNELKQAEQTA